jgi:hypothetical protein
MLYPAELRARSLTTLPKLWGEVPVLQLHEWEISSRVRGARNNLRPAVFGMGTLAQLALKLKTVVDCVSTALPLSRAGW